MRTGIISLPEYAIWAAMIQRCTNPNDKGYKNYGGRGITVHPEWRCFLRFLSDMGRRPGSELTLERVDNDRGYSRDNCIWSTRREQNRNRRSCRPLTVNGRTQLMADWARETGLYEATIHKRLKRGMSPADAVLTPGRHVPAAGT